MATNSDDSGNVYPFPHGESEPPPLPGQLDFFELIGKEPPERRFIMPGWIVRGSAGLLSGLEGVGKSLIAQQMATCAATCRDFLGVHLPLVRAIYISCEDEADELWRRQEAINAALGIDMAHVDGFLKLVSLKGELGNELATFDSFGRIIPEARFHQIRKLCEDFEASLVFLDNAAHFFPGNENARHDVAAFLGLIEQLSIHIDGAVVLLAHPNKQFAQGNTAGNEYSGSTGWSAHVRNRLFINYRQDPKDGTAIDDDDRTLRKSKANYGKRGEEIHFRWKDWAFHLADEVHDTATEERRGAEAAYDNSVFLNCLDTRNKQKRAVSEQKASRTYAPKEFAEMAESKGIGRDRLERAMDRLFRIGVVERGFLWVDRGEGKSRHGLRIAVEKSAQKAADKRSAEPSTTPADLPLTSKLAEERSAEILINQSADLKTGTSAENPAKSTADLSADLPPTSADLSAHTPPQTPPARARAPTREGDAPGLATTRGEEGDDLPIDSRDDDYTPIDWGDDQ